MPAATPSQAVATRLINVAGVGAVVADRIYPSKPTSGATWPYIVYFVTSGGDGMHLSGKNQTREYTVRVEAWAATATEAESVRLAYVAALSGWRDTTEHVLGCFPVGDADEQTSDDASQVSGQSFSLWFKG